MLAASNLSVLLVEDVLTMRFHLKRMLSEIGFKRIQTAASVEEAQVILMVEVVDIVLCDWYLGLSSGLDLLKHLRKKPENERTAFVMLTAENTKDKVVEALNSGVDDYLVKPVSAAMVRAKVESALAKRSKK
ncbi:response regulator [bacterium]|nr:response regulator [bacterium]